MRMASHSIHSVLAAHGPGLTSEVAARLRTLGVSPAAARQRISRLSPDVRILHGLPFPKRARFIYLDDQFGSARYWDSLIRAIDTANPAYAAALNGIRARGGVVPIEHFDIISGSPVKQSRQLASSAVLDRLLSVRLLKRHRIDGVGEFIFLDGPDLPDPFHWFNVLRPRLITEDVLLNAIRSWAGRMNMASPNAMTIRGGPEPPQFATVRFDLCGPSYLRPMQRFRQGKLLPGFLVADVLLGQELNEAFVAPFIRKCTLLSYVRRARPFMPMLIADHFTPDALRACRARGIVATRPETIFGQDVGRALTDLLQTLSNAAAVAASDPGHIEDLFRQLSKIEGAAANIRGALFELIVGHLVRSIEGGSIDIGVLVHDQGRSAEIDVRHVNEREVTIYECRGNQPSTRVTAETIKKWLEEKVPTIYGALNAAGRFDNSQFRFEYWSCGTFDEEALALLQGARKRIRRYEVAWKDSTAIKQYSQRIRAGGIRKILNEHYFNHPLQGLDANSSSRVSQVA